MPSARLSLLIRLCRTDFNDAKLIEPKRFKRFLNLLLIELIDHFQRIEEADAVKLIADHRDRDILHVVERAHRLAENTAF